MKTIWRQIDGIWTPVKYGCQTCEATYRTKVVALRHIEKCRINTSKRLEREENKNMPIQAIMKDGKRYFRWGDSGKLYEKREDAEKQARAAYASGYREPKQNKENK